MYNKLIRKGKARNEILVAKKAKLRTEVSGKMIVVP